jgi:hypothetical protein
MLILTSYCNLWMTRDLCKDLSRPGNKRAGSIFVPLFNSLVDGQMRETSTAAG